MSKQEQPSQLQESKESGKEVSYFKKLGLKNAIFTYKTPFDKSDLPSLENILRGSIKSFAIGYSIKASLALIFTVIRFSKVKKNPSKILHCIFNRNNLRLGTFMGLNTFIMKSLIVILRILRKKDSPSGYLISGFIASYISSFLYQKPQVSLMGYFGLARVFDCVYNYLANKGYIKKRQMNYALIYAIVITPVAYGYGYEPYLIPENIIRLWTRVLQMNTSELKFRTLWIEMTRRRLTKKGGILDDQFLK